jgi:hypothetical protein
MNEFAERVMVRNIQQLLAERGIERTPTQVQVHVRSVALMNRLSVLAAYEALEDKLLSQNPNVGEWGNL